MDNVTESIRRKYPYPIAKCYEKLVRTRDVSDRRDQARYLFEATLKYCTHISKLSFVAVDEKIDFSGHDKVVFSCRLGA